MWRVATGIGFVGMRARSRRVLACANRRLRPTLCLEALWLCPFAPAVWPALAVGRLRRGAKQRGMSKTAADLRAARRCYETVMEETTYMRGKIILSKTSCFWPIALFPHFERSHTLVFAGRDWAKDVRFSIGFACLCLTETVLSCRLVFPPLLLFEIEPSNVLAVSKIEEKEGLIDIRFTNAKLGWLTRFALSGDPAIPRNRVILNVEDDLESGLRELGRLCPRRYPEGMGM